MNVYTNCIAALLLYISHLIYAGNINFDEFLEEENEEPREANVQKETKCMYIEINIYQQFKDHTSSALQIKKTLDNKCHF